MRRATALLYGLQLAGWEQKELMRKSLSDSDGQPIAGPGLLDGQVSDFQEDDRDPDQDAEDAANPKTQQHGSC